MDTLAERMLARANEIYVEKKLSKYPRSTNLLSPTIESTQTLAVLEACAEEIQQLREEMERYYERKHDDGYD